VRGNILHDNAGAGLHMNGDVSQGGVGLIDHALVEYNIIYNNGALGGSGINCDGVVDSVYLDNLIYAEHASGISLYQIDASGPSVNDTIIGNTFILASDGRWALNIGNLSTGATVYDNMFLNENPSHGSISFDSTASMAGLQCDHNVLCTGSNVATEDGGNTDMSFAQWQAAGFDTHSITATEAQLFVNASGGNYNLAVGSPAIGIGVTSFNGTTAPTTDIVGEPRPGPDGYSIGAYEVPTSGATTSAVATATGTATATSTTTGTATATSTATATATGTTTSGATGTVVPASGGGGGSSGCGLGGSIGTVIAGMLCVWTRRRRQARVA